MCVCVLKQQHFDKLFCLLTQKALFVDLHLKAVKSWKLFHAVFKLYEQSF